MKQIIYMILVCRAFFVLTVEPVSDLVGDQSGSPSSSNLKEVSKPKSKATSKPKSKATSKPKSKEASISASITATMPDSNAGPSNSAHTPQLLKDNLLSSHWINSCLASFHLDDSSLSSLLLASLQWFLSYCCQ